MIASAMHIATVRAEVSPEPTDRENERRMSEGVKLSTAAVMNRFSLAYVRDQLEKTEELLENVTKSAATSFKLFAMATRNAMHVNKTSLLRTRDIEHVLESIEETQKRYLIATPPD